MKLRKLSTGLLAVLIMVVGGLIADVGPADAAPPGHETKSAASVEAWKLNCEAAGNRQWTYRSSPTSIRIECWAAKKTTRCSERPDGNFDCYVTARRGPSDHIWESDVPTGSGCNGDDLIFPTLGPEDSYTFVCTDFDDFVAKCVWNGGSYDCREYIPLVYVDPTEKPRLPRPFEKRPVSPIPTPRDDKLRDVRDKVPTQGFLSIGS